MKKACDRMIAGFLLFPSKYENFILVIRLQQKSVVHPKGRLCKMLSFREDNTL